MRIRRIVLALVMGNLCVVACNRSADSSGRGGDPPNQEGIEGTWDMVSRDRGDGPLPSPGIQIVISKERLVLRAPDGDTKVMGDIARLDSAKTPNEIDLRNAGEVGHGIHARDGDSLQLIIADPGQPRPTAFVGAREAMLFRLKRAR